MADQGAAGQPGEMVRGSFVSAAPAERARERQCVICFDDVDDQVRASLEPCGHVYHLNCVDQWTADHDTCSYCRDAATKVLAVRRVDGLYEQSRDIAPAPAFTAELSGVLVTPGVTLSNLSPLPFYEISSTLDTPIVYADGGYLHEISAQQPLRVFDVSDGATVMVNGQQHSMAVAVAQLRQARGVDANRLQAILLELVRVGSSILPRPDGQNPNMIPPIPEPAEDDEDADDEADDSDDEEEADDVLIELPVVAPRTRRQRAARGGRGRRGRRLAARSTIGTRSRSMSVSTRGRRYSSTRTSMVSSSLSDTESDDSRVVTRAGRRMRDAARRQRQHRRRRRGRRSSTY